MLKRWLNALHVALVKYRMRRICYMLIKMSPNRYALELLRNVNPHVKALEDKFNELNELLKSIDPTHPANLG